MWSNSWELCTFEYEWNIQNRLGMQNRSPLCYTFIVSIGGFLFGFDASVISGAIVYLDTWFELSSLSKGWIVSALAFSAMFAMLGGGVLSDRVGRKHSVKSTAYGIRTRATAVKGRRPRPLDERGIFSFWEPDGNWTHGLQGHNLAL